MSIMIHGALIYLYGLTASGNHALVYAHAYCSRPLTHSVNSPKQLVNIGAGFKQEISLDGYIDCMGQ